MLTGWANIAVAVCVILELILAEQARLDRGTPLGARHTAIVSRSTEVNA